MKILPDTHKLNLFGYQISVTVRPSERKANPRSTKAIGQQLRMAAMRVTANMRIWAEDNLND